MCIRDSPQDSCQLVHEFDDLLVVKVYDVVLEEGDGLEQKVGLRPVSYTHLDVYKRQHPVRHGGPHQCAFHVTVFINSIYSFGDNSLKNWLGGQ